MERTIGACFALVQIAWQVGRCLNISEVTKSHPKGDDDIKFSVD